MNTPHDPRRHPLQDDEVELARVLRALPAGEPSSKVDAAILAAAADAVAGDTPAARPRRGVKRVAWALPTWAIGTAAAAVLAIGIGTQLVPRPAPTAESAARPSAPASARTSADDRLDVELIERKREIPPTFPPPDPPAPTPPPPPPPAVALPPPALEQAPLPATAAPAPEAFPTPQFAAPPAPAAPSVEDRRPRGDNVERLRSSPSEINRLDTARRLEARQAETERARAAVARDLASGESARAQAADAGSAAEMDAATDAGKPAGAAAPRVLPPVAEDAALPPDAWVARVRERWRAGDRDGARASLRRLRDAHPDTAIPADLAPLLR